MIKIDLADVEVTPEMLGIVAELMTDIYMDRVDILTEFLDTLYGSYCIAEVSNDKLAEYLKGLTNE